jgi:hypothetical protein
MKMNSKSIMGLVLAIVLPLIMLIAGCTRSEAQTPTSTPPASKPTQVPFQQTVGDFIKNTSTFKFDGVVGSIKTIKTEPGWSPVFKSVALTIGYQTAHPGHGDRTGQVLAQVITDHTAVVLVNLEKGTVVMAVCDKTWDMVNDKNPPASVSGLVISGGDIASPDGPTDAPRVFIYEVKRDDGTIAKVSYTAYPPSPVGDVNRNKITLDISGGSINIGDRMEALGRLDKETNTIVVADQGDYIRTWNPASSPVFTTPSD